MGAFFSALILCRTQEALRQTPAMALGTADHVWTISELIEAALKAIQRRRQFRVMQGDLFD
jgi:hypothetical protein